MEIKNEIIESSYYDKETLVSEIEKNETKKIRVTVGEKKNNAYINIREWYLDTTDEWRPGKQGITLNFELLDDVLNTLNYIKEEMS